MKIKMKKALTALLTAGILAAAALQASAEELEPVMETGDGTSTVEIVAEGTCGDNLTWVLDDAGTLTISGEGEMEDYKKLYSSSHTYYSTAPWYSCRSEISRIIIGDGVTSIGANAFYNCNLLNEIVFSYNITVIKQSAFELCVSLRTVECPKNLVAIEEYAFYNCSALMEVVFSKILTDIKAYAFCNCYALENIVFLEGSDVTHELTIAEYAFASCGNLTGIVLPQSLTEIAYGAFMHCDALKELVFPKNFSVLGEYAFSHCDALEKATFNGNAPEMPNNTFNMLHEDFTIYYNPTASGWTTPEWNGYPAYPYTSGTVFNSVTLPDIFTGASSVEYNKDYTFTVSSTDGQHYDYSNITAVMGKTTVPVIDNGDGSYTVEKVIGDLVITGERIPKIYTVTHDYPDPKEDIVSTITSESNGNGNVIGIDYFTVSDLDDYRVVSVVYADGTEISYNNVQWYYNPILDRAYRWVYDGEFHDVQLKTDFITQDIIITYEKISEDTLVCLENYTNNEVDGYRQYAFSDEDYSFELLTPDAYSLYSVTAKVNGKIVPVSEDNFVYTIAADDIEEGLLLIIVETCLPCTDGTANHSFTQYTYNKDATCTEDGTKTAVCDNGCGEKDTVTAPKTALGHSFTDYITDADGLTKTAECDNGCGETDTVPVQTTYSGTCGDDLTWELSNGVLTISGTGEMWDNPKGWYSCKDQIRKLVINEGVTSVGEAAFQDCENLDVISFPDTLTSIGWWAFECCISIEELELPEGLTTVGDSAFARCESLEDVELPSTLTALADSMFDQCSSLRSIDLPKTVKSVGDRTFAYTPLRRIIFPAGLEELIDGAFLGCDSLTEIRFSGDAPEFGYKIFENVTATAYYPYKNPTWTSKELQNHGGTLTWVAEGSGAQLTFEAKTVYGSQSCTVDLYLKGAEKATSLAITDLEISSKYAEIVSAEWLLTDAVMNDVNLEDGSAVIAYDEATDMNGPIFRLYIDTERVTREYADEILCSAVLEIGTNRVAVNVREGELVILHAIPGDTNGDGYVTSADAIYLLRYTMLPDRYPLTGVWFDYNNDGSVTADDAVYLLYHAMLPDEYPLVEKSDGGDTGFEDDPYLKGDILYVEPEEDGTVWYYYSSREILPDASDFEDEYDDAKYSGTADVDGGGIEKIILDGDILKDFPYVIVSFLPEEYENSSDRKFCCPVIVEV